MHENKNAPQEIIQLHCNDLSSLMSLAFCLNLSTYRNSIHIYMDIMHLEVKQDVFNNSKVGTVFWKIKSQITLA